MIKSMTGFGRGRVENEGRNFTVEINSKIILSIFIETNPKTDLPLF
jgi:uncharacterized protein YicC (UPF0701 family)